MQGLSKIRLDKNKQQAKSAAQYRKPSQFKTMSSFVTPEVDWEKEQQRKNKIRKLSRKKYNKISANYK